AASTTSVPLKEIGATVTVTVKQATGGGGGGGGTTTVSGADTSLVAPTNITAPTQQNTSNVGTAAFTSVPFGDNWQAHATKTTTGGGGTTVSGDSPLFNIDSSTATRTGTGASTVCSISVSVTVS